jgi:YfiH family protein
MKYLFSDRFGGVSNAPHESLNLALHVEDNPLHVKKNREILAKKIGTKNLIFMDQIHSDHIEVIKDLNIKKVLKTDAMVSDIPDLALCVMVADCIPILFYDKVKKVIGVAHAGRNGVKKKIAVKTIQKMIDEFSSKLEDIKIVLGPSIQKCCYEVKKDVVVGFEDYLHVRKQKIYLDIVKKCTDDLKNIGVKIENIDVSAICTCCDENYFSYRRDGVTGRFCGVIKL